MRKVVKALISVPLLLMILSCEFEGLMIFNELFELLFAIFEGQLFIHFRFTPTAESEEYISQTGSTQRMSCHQSSSFIFLCKRINRNRVFLFQ